MADTPLYDPKQDAVERKGMNDGLDASQVLNVVSGINKSKDGFLQVLEQAKEYMGIVGAGSAEVLTQDAKKEHELLDSNRQDSINRTGAAAAEMGGEVLPAFALPASAFIGTARGAMTGAGLSATQFKQDPNASRGMDIATGAAVGGLFGRLFSGKAKEAAEKELLMLTHDKKPAQLFLPAPQRHRMDGLGAQDFAPASANGLQRGVAAGKGMVPVPQRGQAMVPVAQRAAPSQPVSPVAGKVAQDFTQTPLRGQLPMSTGSLMPNSAAGASQRAGVARTAAQKIDTSPKMGLGRAAREKAMAGLEKAKEAAGRAARKVERIKEAAQRSGVPAAQKVMAKAQAELAAKSRTVGVLTARLAGKVPEHLPTRAAAASMARSELFAGQATGNKTVRGLQAELAKARKAMEANTKALKAKKDKLDAALAKVKSNPQLASRAKTAEDDYIAALMIKAELAKAAGVPAKVAAKKALLETAGVKSVPKNRTQLKEELGLKGDFPNATAENLQKVVDSRARTPASEAARIGAKAETLKAEPMHRMTKAAMVEELGLPAGAKRLHHSVLLEKLKAHRKAAAKPAGKEAPADRLQRELGLTAKQAKDIGVKGMAQMWNKKNTTQGGFVDAKVANIAGGAAIGGVAGGIAGDGDPAAVLTGAVVGGLGGKAVAGRKHRTAIRSKPETKAAMDIGNALKTTQGGMAKAKALAAEIKKGLPREITSVWEEVSQGADNYVGALITRLEQISPKLADGMIKAEGLTHMKAGQWIDRGRPLEAAWSKAKLTDAQHLDYKQALLGNRDAAMSLMRKNGHHALADTIKNDIIPVMDEMAAYLKANGYDTVHMRKGFFPRQVVDTKPFGTVPEFESYLASVAHDKGVVLGQHGEENAITSLLNGLLVGKQKAVFGKSANSLKMRKVGRVTRDNVDAYADPVQSMNNYIESVTRQVERQRYLSSHGAKDVVGPNGENLDSAVKGMRAMLLKDNPNTQEVNEAVELIKSRFGNGERAPAKLTQNFKNYTYTVLLANPMSALTQLGDVALSAHKNGIANTVAAFVEEMGPRSMRASTKTGIDKSNLLGLHEVAADFASGMSSRDILGKALRYSGFTRMDELGKNTFINASMRANKQMKHADFKNKWGRFFDPEGFANGVTPRTDALYQKVQNFQKIDQTNKDDIGLMLWNELHQSQPIGLSSLPKAYHDNPNGRMLYMLQSFNLKLLDIMRKDVLHKAKRGDYIGSAKAATTLGGYFTLMNGSIDQFKDFLRGREREGVGEMLGNNMMKMFGLNKFAVDTGMNEGVGKMAQNIIAPPTALFDDPARLAEMGGIFERLTK